VLEVEKAEAGRQHRGERRNLVAGGRERRQLLEPFEPLERFDLVERDVELAERDQPAERRDGAQPVVAQAERAQPRHRLGRQLERLEVVEREVQTAEPWQRCEGAGLDRADVVGLEAERRVV